MVKGISNIFKKKGKSYKEIHQSDVYSDPSAQHDLVKRVSNEEQSEECFYSDPTTRPRIRPSVLSTSNSGYNEITSHSPAGHSPSTHSPATPNPAHNPNYMFQEPYEIPIEVFEVKSSGGSSPPIIVNYNPDWDEQLLVPYPEQPYPEQSYINEPANRESVCEADSEDEGSELGDQEMMNIHSTTKNGIAGLYQNIETVEVKQTFASNSLFGGYEDVWKSDSVKQSLYTNIDSEECRSNPEINKVGATPVKPARRATSSQMEKPKLSVKYVTPPLPASSRTAASRPVDTRQGDAAASRPVDTRQGDENTPPQPKVRPGSEERRVEICSSEEIEASCDLDIQQQRWYFGPFTRLRAEVRLDSAPSSTFLVRVSTNDNSFILSLKLASASVAHIKIHSTDQGVSLVGSNKTFSSVPVMIANYTRTPIAIRQLGLQQILHCGLVAKS